MADAVRVCSGLGLRLELYGACSRTRLHKGFPEGDEVYGLKVEGRPPCVAYCLFFQPLLVAELSLYPVSFFKAAGLRRIVLVEGLAYRGQVSW